jgi:peptide/nickel transport system ATP-binding protein
MYAGKLVERAPTDVIINAPRHPYTKMLIAALPKMGVKYTEQKLTGIPGNPPPLLNPPIGCRFRDRCPAAFAKCAAEPPFVSLADGHSVACWKEMDKHAQAG